jgi:hypothetical protein
MPAYLFLPRMRRQYRCTKKGDSIPTESFWSKGFDRIPCKTNQGFAYSKRALFALISREAFRVLKPGGLMISETSDHINWLFQGTYRSVLHERNVEGDDVVSFHSRYDPSKGTFERLFVDFAHSSRKHRGSSTSGHLGYSGT